MSKVTLHDKPPFDDELVRQLLAQKESLFFEAKRVAGEKLTKALQTIVAFANTDGGFLVLGLEDEAKAKGRNRVYGIQENPAAVDEIRRLISTRITPTLPQPSFAEIGCTLRDGSNGSIMIVRVEKSPLVHSIVLDGTWKRLRTGNAELVAEEITRLAFDRGAISAETQLANVPFDLLETDYWRMYASKRKLTRSIGEALRHLGLARFDPAGSLFPLTAAVLLFADEPGGLLGVKASIRVFTYEGSQIEHNPEPNLLKPPVAFSGPLIAQVQKAYEHLMRELATGMQMGRMGFETAHRYPARVIREALTNAVIHRDYSIPADVHVRVFCDRIEVESPGKLPGNVTVRNIREIGSVSRNPLVVSNLREFPDPPNLDAGEGVRMMFKTMDAAGLYPPLFLTGATTGRDTIQVVMLNESKPSVWDQVSQYLDKHGSIGNTEVRRIMSTDTLAASRAIKAWVERGLLIPQNPESAKKYRRYQRPESENIISLFSCEMDNKKRF